MYRQLIVICLLFAFSDCGKISEWTGIVFGKPKSNDESASRNRPLSQGAQNYLEDNTNGVLNIVDRAKNISCVYTYKRGLKTSLICNGNAECKIVITNDQGSTWKCGNSYKCTIWNKDENMKVLNPPKGECSQDIREIIKAPSRNPCQPGEQVARDGSCRPTFDI